MPSVKSAAIKAVLSGQARGTGNAKVAAFQRAIKKTVDRQQRRRPEIDKSWSVRPIRSMQIGAIELMPASPGMLNREVEVVVETSEIEAFDRASYKVDFEDAQRSFQSQSSFELARSLVIFKVCAIPPVVQNASFLYKLATRVMGHALPDSVIRASFFKHFCGGETERDLVPVMERLSAHGVGAILDYAAEADVDEGSAPRGDHADHPETLSEAACDANAAIVLTAIDAAAAVAEGNPNSKLPFAACKMTGIGKPELLERISTVLVSLRDSFNELDTDGNGRLTAAEFVDGLFKAGTALAAPELAKIFAELDLDADGELDYYDWLARLDPSDASTHAIFTGSFTPLDEPAYTQLEGESWDPLTKKERQEYSRMLARASHIAECAARKGVRLLVDAEQTYMQPAIDHMALLMMQKYNTEQPYIFNTYQCYLKDAPERVNRDMERAQRQGFVFAAKCVRGAYMVQESRLAREKGYENPVHDTKEDTHTCYDAVVDTILRVKTSVMVDGEPAGLVQQEKMGKTEIDVAELRRRRSAVMVASHNEESIIKAVRRMGELRLLSRDGIFFAQLQGMCDHVSFALGQEGYNVYKYLPYGPVKEVMPYLLRRLEENSDIMGAVGKQRAMIWGELKRRVGMGKTIAA